MKMNEEILSIPPYISTSWRNISALHVEGTDLMITLQNGAMIRVPNQTGDVLEKIFSAYESHLIEPSSIKEKRPKVKRQPQMNLELMLKSEGSPIQSVNVFEHDPQNRDALDLPKSVLEKIATLAQTFGFGLLGNDATPKAEPHCNCVHCQIARAIQPQPNLEESEDEIVTDEDLTFKEWEIKQESSLLYNVINPCNPDEHYQVFLGSPVGCTCGIKNCAHIQAVLRS